jgi:uncharacterized membrane protein
MTAQSTPTRRGGKDEGSVLVLTVGFAVVVMLLVGVVVDASKLFLTRRALASVADGAALAAAQQVDLAAVYRGEDAAALPLSPAAAQAAVTAYVREAAGQTGIVDLRVVAVQVAGPNVSVTLAARAELPLVGAVTGVVTGDADSVDVTYSATARSAVSR